MSLRDIPAARCDSTASTITIASSTTTPIATLVEAINSECGEYAALETGTVGTDAISVGFIYKPESVSLIGETAILDTLTFTDPMQSGTPKNRPAIAQSFKQHATGSALTIAVNHLKSKGSSCGESDDSQETGQANCNQTRTRAAEVETAWLATNPTGVETDKILIIGDLNAYRMEDPISAIKQAGYTDLADHFGGDHAYGYVFDGLVGYLDHALANDALFPYVSGITDWHINADEVNLLDYNDTFVDAGEQWFDAKPSANELFTINPYRSSDHDPVIIGIALPKIPTPITLVQQYNDAIQAGTINGKGPHWFQRLQNRWLFAKLLHLAEHATAAEKPHLTCHLLDEANRYSDNKHRDLIEGSTVAELNIEINRVRKTRNCQP